MSPTRHIDDYLEGKTLDPSIAKTIKGWYLKTEHKRRPPITVFDDFWKKWSLPPRPAPGLFFVLFAAKSGLLYWMDRQCQELLWPESNQPRVSNLRRRRSMNIPNIFAPWLEALPAAGRLSVSRRTSDTMPLYIGKSVNLRSRVLSHLRTLEEAAMLRQSRRITGSAPLARAGSAAAGGAVD